MKSVSLIIIYWFLILVISCFGYLCANQIKTIKSLIKNIFTTFFYCILRCFADIVLYQVLIYLFKFFNFDLKSNLIIVIVVIICDSLFSLFLNRIRNVNNIIK